jgi:hypothetical protein
MPRMLTIRAEQMQILAEENLKCWLLEYLQRNYPVQTNKAGAQSMSAQLSELISAARRRGFRTAEDVRRFVHVGFLLGPDFESRYGWARAILEDPELADPGWRAKSLEEAAVQLLCCPPRNRRARKQDAA